MPRTMRVECPGAIYHVMDRGDRREDIFVDGVDRQDLLRPRAEACQKTGWQVHGMVVWYFAAPEHRPGWIRVGRLLGEHGISQDSATGRQEFERQMEARRLEGQDEAALRPFRRGWCLASEEFIQKLIGNGGSGEAGNPAPHQVDCGPPANGHRQKPHANAASSAPGP